MNTFMPQSIPAVPIPPHPGQPRGICSSCQSQGWGIQNFIAARGLGISLTPGRLPHSSHSVRLPLWDDGILLFLVLIFTNKYWAGCKDVQFFYLQEKRRDGFLRKIRRRIYQILGNNILLWAIASQQKQDGLCSKFETDVALSVCSIIIIGIEQKLIRIPRMKHQP